MELQLKNVYSFSVHPVALLGNDFTNVTVLAILDEDTARQTIDTYATHRQYYPYLPADTPDDSSAYNYVKLRMSGGEIRVIGIPWIINDTIELIQKVPLIVEIGDASLGDIDRIRALLAANRYKVVEIRQK
jgi:hypothetical protein